MSQISASKLSNSVGSERATEVGDAASPPKVSIGLPVFNGEDRLPMAIDSLLAQSYTDFELVISDNGSTHRTESICREYAERDSRIRYERHETNRGLYWNCNRVCERARGQYFCWTAVDCFHGPVYLKRCVAVLDADPGVISCHTRSGYTDETGQPLDGHDPTGDPQMGTSSEPHRRFRDVLLNHGWGTRAFGVIRREPLWKTGLYQKQYGWDKVIMGGLALLGRHELVDELLFFEEDHPTNVAERQNAIGGRVKVFQASTHDRQGRGFNRLLFLQGYWQMVCRFSPDPITSLWCMWWMGAYVMQVRKWGRLTRAAIGRGWNRCAGSLGKSFRLAWFARARRGKAGVQ